MIDYQQISTGATKKANPDAATLCSMLNNWSEHLYFVYAPIEDDNIIKKIEDDLLIRTNSTT